jgi:hypothetical protein
LYGAFVRACRALNTQKRRFSARAVAEMLETAQAILGYDQGYTRLSLRSTAQPLHTRCPIIFGSCFSEVAIGCCPRYDLLDLMLNGPEDKLAQTLHTQVRKPPSWPGSWANSSP